MDHSLIEAAARLCGWEGPSSYGVYGKPPKPMAASNKLTDAGLLALEDALLRTQYWTLLWDAPVGYIWRSGDLRATHAGRATAACLAAQQELGDE